MADKRAYFKLDVGYLTNPKVAAVSIESPTAVLLHIGCIAYAAQHLTDGVVPIKLVARLTGVPADDADLLYAHGLLIDRGNGNAEVHDYLEHQRSAADVKGAEDKAKRAAEARWKRDDDAPSNASSMPDALHPASDATMPREKREERREKDSSAPAAPARAAAFDEFWKLYPKKTEKVDARRKFDKAVKAVGIEAIMAGVTRLANDPNLPEKQYIPNPAKWLGNGGWDDEPYPERPERRQAQQAEIGTAFWGKAAS